MDTAVNRARLAFLADCKDHQLEIRHEDGVYRHLAFRHPDTSLYWFSLVTWPGHLTFTGDMGSYTFARTTDMVEFFLSGRGVNVSYWAEKVQGEEARAGLRAYSEELMRENIEESFRSYADEHGWVLTRTCELWADIQKFVLLDVHDERYATEAVRDFVFRHDGHRAEFDFGGDTWEWDVREYSHRFLYCLHAIRWGCEQYQAVVDSRPLPEPIRPRRFLRGLLTRTPKVTS